MIHPVFARFLRRAVAASVIVLPLTAAQAARYKPSRNASSYSVQFRSQDPRTFYREIINFLDQTSPTNPNTINARATVAELLFDSENYREAAQLYLQLTETPLADKYKLSSFQYRLAECYFHMGLFGEAYDQFVQVAQTGHRSLRAEATLGMAMSALAQGNNATSQAHLDLLLLENPYYKTYGRALYPSGIMLFQNGQYRRALDFFEADPDDPKNLYFAGLSYRRLEDLPRALSLFQQCAQRFPGSVWAQRGAFEVAETYYQQQDYLLASQSFQRLLNEYPNGPLQIEAQFRMAAADMRRERYQDVLTRLEPLLKRDLRPSLADRVRHLLGESWVQLNQVDRLADSIRRRTSDRTRNPDDSYQLTWALAALGRYEESLVMAEEGLNKFSDAELTPKIVLLQGYCYDKLGRSAEALASYQTVVDKFPRSVHAARALHLMALGYAKAQRWQELVTHVNHHFQGLPVETRDVFPEIGFWVTEGQLSLSNFDAAQRGYQRYLAARPDGSLTPYAYLGLSLAQSQSNRLDDGYKTLQQFASLAKQKARKDWLALATLQSANIYYNQKNYEQAISYYRGFQTDFSTDTHIPQAMFQEGQALYRLEYYSDAVKVWQSLVNRYPADALAERAQFQSARTLFDLGQTSASVKAYEFYIAKYPASERVKDARLQLANAFYNAGDYASAIPRYQEFLALYPNAEEVPTVQGYLQTAYVQTGKTDQELEKLTQGQAKSTALADLYWERGAKAYNAKDYPGALSYFEKLLIDFPAASVAPQASFYRAETYFTMERYAEAAAAYRSFMAQYPSDAQVPLAYFHMGASYFNINRFEESAKAFEELATKYPDDPNAQAAAENIPVVYAKLGRLDAAEKATERLLTGIKDPAKRATFLVQLGQAKERSGEFADAVKYYQMVDPAAETYAEAQYYAGVALSKTGNTAAEAKAYERLFNVAPKSNPYRAAGLSRLAEIYIGQGAAQKAFNTYSDVAKTATDESTLSNARSRLEELQKVLKP